MCGRAVTDRLSPTLLNCQNLTAPTLGSRKNLIHLPYQEREQHFSKTSSTSLTDARLHRSAVSRIGCLFRSLPMLQLSHALSQATRIFQSTNRTENANHTSRKQLQKSSRLRGRARKDCSTDQSSSMITRTKSEDNNFIMPHQFTVSP